MDHTNLLALYDQDQRYAITYPGMRREALPHIVRHINTERPRGHVIYSQLNADNADAMIAEQIADFQRQGWHMEWKLFSHDTPPDLRARLEAHEFVIGEEEAVMVLDLQALPPALRQPPTHDVRPITNPDDIDAILRVQDVVWGHDFSHLRRELVAELRDHPDKLNIYASYVADEPVCSAWIRTTPGSPFASLWGGSTLAAHRGQGHYTALLAVRAQAALARGLRFLTIDASPMSGPILEKQGFLTLCRTYECHWRGSEGE